MRYLKDDEIIPGYYAPPDFLFKWAYQTTPERRRGRMLVPKDPQIPKIYNPISARQFWESLYLERWLPGSDPFAGYDLWYAERNRPILSNIDLTTPKKYYFPPDDIYLFLPTKQIAVTYIYSVYKKIPVSMTNIADTQSRLISGLLDPFKIIYPGFRRRFRKLFTLALKSKKIKLLREVFSGLTDTSESMLQSLFPILLEELLNDPSKKSSQEDEEPQEKRYSIFDEADRISIDYELEEDFSALVEIEDLIDEDDYLMDDMEPQFYIDDDIEGEVIYPDGFDPDDDFSYHPEGELYDEYDELDRISMHSSLTGVMDHW